MLDIFNSGKNGVAIPLVGLEITINGLVYKDPICIARLLTIPELERLEKFNTDNHSSRTEIEEEIISNVFESFLGISNEIDWDSMEAGVATTIVNAIVLTSKSMLEDLINSVNRYRSSLNVAHSIQAIVARFMITPFAEVEKLPVNELLRRYAICMNTFPDEVQELKAEE